MALPSFGANWLAVTQPMSPHTAALGVLFLTRIVDGDEDLRHAVLRHLGVLLELVQRFRDLLVGDRHILHEPVARRKLSSAPFAMLFCCSMRLKACSSSSGVTVMLRRLASCICSFSSIRLRSTCVEIRPRFCGVSSMPEERMTSCRRLPRSLSETTSSLTMAAMRVSCAAAAPARRRRKESARIGLMSGTKPFKTQRGALPARAPPYTAEGALSPGARCLRRPQNVASELPISPRFLKTMVKTREVPGLTSPLTMPDWVSDVMKATHSSR